MNFYLWQFIKFVWNASWDVMDDIVDELGEDEIIEESGKLYLFV
jgi:hypothetical protein